MPSLSLEQLHELVNGTGAAIRLRQRLQPAGGAGDKMFPSSYATNDKLALKYAVEHRRLDGVDVPCALLDSVASQANRMEEALLAAWHAGRLDFPVIGVDFTGEAGLEDLGIITALQAPHRIADAILRDAMTTDGIPFRDTPNGRAFTAAGTRNASALYALCPTALVFGVWDSTGPKGGMGAKFPRALTGEVVAIGYKEGVKVGSRIDPLAIAAGVPIYESASEHTDWTTEEGAARRDGKGKPVPFSRGASDAKSKGKPSAANHSNIAPSIDALAGGITADFALQTLVLSLAGLRRLEFRTDLDGTPLTSPAEATANARTALAALALAGIVAARAAGFDLRSRCLLVPDGAAALEIVGMDGSVTPFELDPSVSAELLRDASAKAAELGLPWTRSPLALVPAPKLVALIKASRALHVAPEDAQGE
jgi:CRISPR-associated protein Csb1